MDGLMDSWQDRLMDQRIKQQIVQSLRIIESLICVSSGWVESQ